GRPGYDPRDLLKLYLYGYLHTIRPRPCGLGAPPSSIPSPRSSTVSSAIPDCCCEAPAAQRSKSGSPPWHTTCNASSTCSAAQHSPKNSTLHDAKQERSPTGSAPFKSKNDPRSVTGSCGRPFFLRVAMLYRLIL